MSGPETLRPGKLSEFHGQEDVARRVGIILDAAKRRGELPDHLLFSGPPGLGKTTLAGIVSHELDVPLVTTSGPAIERARDLVGLLTSLNRPSVVFIDEIHRLPRNVEELLYPAMEDQVLDLTVGEGAKSRVVRLPLSPFVLVGATTQAGMVAAPLRDRFGYVARLRLYDEPALIVIVERAASVLSVTLDDDAASAIALRSRGTPRIANSLLRRVRDWATSKDIATISHSKANEALEDFGIDALGLDHVDRELLSALCRNFGGGPVGLSTLAAAIGESSQTLDEVYEPYLMARGLLGRTPRGRIATPMAYQHLGLPVPAAVQAASLTLPGLDESSLTSP